MNLYSGYFKKYKWGFLVAIFCVALEATCDLLGPTLMAHIIDDGIRLGSVDSVLYWGGLMLLVTLFGAVLAVTRSILASRVSQRMGADLRRDVFAKILRFSESGADAIQSGSLITRMTNDTSQITQFVNGMMRIFLKAPITCVGSIVLATMLNPRLSLIIYTLVLIVGGLIFISMKLSYPRFSRLQAAMDRVNAVVQEYLIGVRLVKAFGTYDEETERFDAANRDMTERSVSAQMIITLVSPLLTLAVGAGTIVAVYAGSRMFVSGNILPGDISAFTIYMTQILSSLMMITNIFNTFVRTKASNQRIVEVLRSPEDFAPAGIAVPPKLGGVVFDDITFTYPNGSGVPAIKHLSFAVQPGESIAVIGPTGSGKSTLCWLLMRFYDVDSGHIVVDGRNIRDYAPDALRGGMALVPQRPMLFSGSVAENIRWGDARATDEEMKIAADTAQAQFIEHMPLKFDSELGSGGVNLSGGQKQRIALARGLVRHSPILILDDSTSALDALTEAKVRSALMENRDRTLFTVTQRCSTAMFADRILVLENGVSVGFGTHETLMQSCEVYIDIYRSQIDSGREA